MFNTTEYIPPPSPFHEDKSNFLKMLAHSGETYDVQVWIAEGADNGGTEVTLYTGRNEKRKPLIKLFFNSAGEFTHIYGIK